MLKKKYRQLYQAYLADIAERHRERGVTGLKHRVLWLFEYLQKEGLELEALRTKEAQNYQGYLLEKGEEVKGGYAHSTVLCYLKAAASFYEFLKRRGMVAANPFKQIRRIGREKRLPKNILKEEELNRLLEELCSFNLAGDLKRQILRYRVHVVAELQYASGLRISEVAALEVSDIDFQRKMVRVREGKGGVSRFAFLNEFAASVLKLYIEKLRPLVLSERNTPNDRLLFGTRFGSFGHTVNKELSSVSKKLGLPGITSHGFRHALGYHLLRAGANIRYIQQILGHKRLAETEVYTKVDKENLKEVLDTYHPRQWRKEKTNEDTNACIREGNI